MKKTIVITTILFMLLGCESGVQNKGTVIKEAPSGIVDRGEVKASSWSANTTSSKASSSNKIFSKSGQPGYYLQVGLFTKYDPSPSFIRQLNESPFKFIILNKSGNQHALVGPYKSYNEAKGKIVSVKSSLHTKTFVVQVLRP